MSPAVTKLVAGLAPVRQTLPYGTKAPIMVRPRMAGELYFTLMVFPLRRMLALAGGLARGGSGVGKGAASSALLCTGRPGDWAERLVAAKRTAIAIGRSSGKFFRAILSRTYFGSSSRPETLNATPLVAPWRGCDPPTATVYRPGKITRLPSESTSLSERGSKVNSTCVDWPAAR